MEFSAIIVDDEVYARVSVKKRVDWEHIGVQVAGEAAGGEAALALIAETRPDIVITDIKMPGMDGLELIRRAKIRDPNLAFIILSGYGDFTYAKQAIKLGVNDFIEKPVNETELGNALRAAADKLRAGRKPRRQAAEGRPTDPVSGDCRGDCRGDCPDLVRRIVDYVDACYSAPLTLNGIGQRFFMNPTYVSTLFKQKTGVNLSQHIENVRMNHAKRLLTNSALSLGEVALAVGYNDTNYFGKVFRKSTGLTPLDFRKQHGQTPNTKGVL